MYKLFCHSLTAYKLDLIWEKYKSAKKGYHDLCSFTVRPP